MGKSTSEDQFLLLDPDSDIVISDESQIAIIKISYWEPIGHHYILSRSGR